MDLPWALRTARAFTSHSPLSDGEEGAEDESSLAATVVIEAIASPVVLNTDALLSNVSLFVALKAEVIGAHPVMSIDVYPM